MLTLNFVNVCNYDVYKVQTWNCEDLATHCTLGSGGLSQQRQIAEKCTQGFVGRAILSGLATIAANSVDDIALAAGKAATASTTKTVARVSSAFWIVGASVEVVSLGYRCWKLATVLCFSIFVACVFYFFCLFVCLFVFILLCLFVGYHTIANLRKHPFKRIPIVFLNCYKPSANQFHGLWYRMIVQKPRIEMMLLYHGYKRAYIFMTCIIVFCACFFFYFENIRNDHK